MLPTLISSESCGRLQTLDTIMTGSWISLSDLRSQHYVHSVLFFIPAKTKMIEAQQGNSREEKHPF